jgi:hypothetical protein
MLRKSMTALHRSISAIACAMAFVASCAAAEVIPQELAVESNGGLVAVTRYAAEGTASRPAVLVLHGAGGIDVNAKAYACHGFALKSSAATVFAVIRIRLAVRGKTGPPQGICQRAIARRRGRAALFRRPHVKTRRTLTPPSGTINSLNLQYFSGLGRGHDRRRS